MDEKFMTKQNIRRRHPGFQDLVTGFFLLEQTADWESDVCCSPEHTSDKHVRDTSQQGLREMRRHITGLSSIISGCKPTQWGFSSLLYTHTASSGKQNGRAAAGLRATHPQSLEPSRWVSPPHMTWTDCVKPSHLYRKHRDSPDSLWPLVSVLQSIVSKN